MTAASIGFDKNLLPTASLTQLPPGVFPTIFAAAGRITQLDKDEIVVAQRPGSDSFKLTSIDGKINLDFARLSPNLLAQPQTDGAWQDFLSVAVGDVDRLYDSSGNYHDDIVVGWFSQRDYQNNIIEPHLAATT